MEDKPNTLRQFADVGLIYKAGAPLDPCGMPEGRAKVLLPVSPDVYYFSNGIYVQYNTETGEERKLNIPHE